MPLPFIVAGGVAAAAVVTSYVAYETMNSSGSSKSSDDSLRREQARLDKEKRAKESRANLEKLKSYAERRSDSLADEYGIDREAEISAKGFAEARALALGSSYFVRKMANVEALGDESKSKYDLYMLVAGPLISEVPLPCETRIEYLRTASKKHIDHGLEIEELKTSIARYEQALERLEDASECVG